jgi:hypothetical protein
MPDDDDSQQPASRPDARDHTVSFRISEQVYQDAAARAKLERRSLGSILRAWLTLFSQDEAPSPPELPDDETRAAKRPRPKPKRQRRK